MTGITLPTDTQQSRLTPRATAPQEDVLDTLREYERLARIATPEYTIVSLFSEDGVEWVPFWLSKTPPAVVHSRIIRGTVMTEEWRTWDEAIPADEATAAEWLANPATRLRAFTERATLRRAFADVIVGREQPATSLAAPAPAIDENEAREVAASLAHPWDAAPQPAITDDVWAPAPVAERPRPLDHLPSNRADRRAEKRKGARRGR